MKCKICKSSNSFDKYNVREMMFGIRDEFLYFQCNNCECLQIAKVPDNMEKYYPENYYSFNISFKYSKWKIEEFLKKERDNYTIFKKGKLGKLINTFLPNKDPHFNILSKIPVTKESTILDVGCGNGKFLKSLRILGFENLMGVDPYIDEDIVYDNKLEIQKKSIHQLTESKDIIMLHHSFEHLEDPYETLVSVNRLLNENGYCIIRIPTVSSYAWKHYRENWVQLDAPRHFFLHSRKSMDILTKRASLYIEKIVYDSSEFQFIGSERYLQDIPLRVSGDETIFSKEQINSFKSKAKELNEKNEGDACAFIIRKSN